MARSSDRPATVPQGAAGDPATRRRAPVRDPERPPEPMEAPALWHPPGDDGVTDDGAALREWVDRHALHPLALLPVANGGELYVRRGIGAVAFFRRGKGVLAVGGALTAARDHRATLEAFLAWCARNGLTARFVHFAAPTAEALAGLGFRLDQLGASYALGFEGDALRGKRYQQVRRKLNKARREGVTVERIATVARFAEVRPALGEINRQWLRQKGSKPIELLVCDFDRIAPDADTLVYAAWHRGEIVAYLVFSRVPGEAAGWFHNLSRRRTGCVDGTMQLLVSTFMEDRGPGTLYFGFTPLVELSAPAYPHSAIVGWIVRLLARFGGLVYPARSQRQYKVSWCPTRVDPEYLAYRGSTLAASIWFLRATNSV